MSDKKQGEIENVGMDRAIKIVRDVLNQAMIDENKYMGSASGTLMDLKNKLINALEDAGARLGTEW